jgi:hypothetical protein
MEVKKKMTWVEIEFEEYREILDGIDVPTVYSEGFKEVTGVTVPGVPNAYQPMLKAERVGLVWRYWKDSGLKK